MSIILRELLDLFPAHIRGKMCDELIHFHHALDKRHPIGIKFRFIGYQPSEKVRCEESDLYLAIRLPIPMPTTMNSQRSETGTYGSPG
jgi:hypothetical protein